jgi:hypothetical protein
MTDKITKFDPHLTRGIAVGDQVQLTGKGGDSCSVTVERVTSINSFTSTSGTSFELASYRWTVQDVSHTLPSVDGVYGQGGAGRVVRLSEGVWTDVSGSGAPISTDEILDLMPMARMEFVTKVHADVARVVDKVAKDYSVGNNINAVTLKRELEKSIENERSI